MIKRVDTYDNGVLINTEYVDVPDEENHSDIIAAIESMTPEQLEALRNLLGLQ
jgi:hypothetical protein